MSLTLYQLALEACIRHCPVSLTRYLTHAKPTQLLAVTKKIDWCQPFNTFYRAILDRTRKIVKYQPGQYCTFINGILVYLDNIGKTQELTHYNVETHIINQYMFNTIPSGQNTICCGKFDTTVKYKYNNGRPKDFVIEDPFKSFHVEINGMSFSVDLNNNCKVTVETFIDTYSFYYPSGYQCWFSGAYLVIRNNQAKRKQYYYSCINLQKFTKLYANKF